MSIVRRRYYTWLIRAYIKRWSKTIIASLLIGVVVFFLAGAVLNFYLLPVIEKKVQKIGYAGSYTAQTLPNEILYDVSYGLTKTLANGSIIPAGAYKWDIRDGGRTYVLYIKRGQYFHDGHELTSSTLTLNFADVTRKNVDEYTVEYHLKEPYGPFISLLSKPIISKNLSGLGKYKIEKEDVNAGFVHYLILESTDNSGSKKIITFYPTQDALRAALALGEIDNGIGMDSTLIGKSNFEKWNNFKVVKRTDYSTLVTLFYNNDDKNLSDKKVRQALSYAIPPEFSEGERAYSPIPPNSIYFSKVPNWGITSEELSKNLLSNENDIKKSTLEISTIEGFEPEALKVQKTWEDIGIKSKIKIVSELPTVFQILIYPIKVPGDPDQYTLWHSAQINNITKYKNLRIDKLLEDGRSTNDIERRIGIYSDFQKYLIDDAPATFLYFPTEFDVVKK